MSAELTDPKLLKTVISRMKDGNAVNFACVKLEDGSVQFALHPKRKDKDLLRELAQQTVQKVKAQAHGAAQLDPSGELVLICRKAFPSLDKDVARLGKDQRLGFTSVRQSEDLSEQRQTIEAEGEEDPGETLDVPEDEINDWIGKTVNDQTLKAAMALRLAGTKFNDWLAKREDQKLFDQFYGLGDQLLEVVTGEIKGLIPGNAMAKGALDAIFGNALTGYGDTLKKAILGETSVDDPKKIGEAVRTGLDTLAAELLRQSESRDLGARLKAGNEALWTEVAMMYLSEGNRDGAAEHLLGTLGLLRFGDDMVKQILRVEVAAYLEWLDTNRPGQNPILRAVKSNFNRVDTAPFSEEAARIADDALSNP